MTNKDSHPLASLEIGPAETDAQLIRRVGKQEADRRLKALAQANAVLVQLQDLQNRVIELRVSYILRIGLAERMLSRNAGEIMVPPFELREAEKTFSQLSGKLDTLLGTVPMLSSRDREQLIVFLVQELQQVYSAIKKSTKSQQPSALRDLLSHPPQLVQKHLTRLEVRLLGPPVILPERFRSVEANCIGSGHNPSLLEGPFSPVNLANGSAKRAFEEAISADVVVRMLAREEGRLRRALGPQGLAFAVVGEWFGESAKRVENICDLYRKKQKHRDSQRK